MFTFSELISDFTFWLARSIFFCSVFRFTAWPYGSLPSLRSESEQSYQSTKPLSKAAIGSAAVRGFARRYCSNSRTTPTPGLSAAARLRRFTFHLHVIGLSWRVSFPLFSPPVKRRLQSKLRKKWSPCQWPKLPQPKCLFLREPGGVEAAAQVTAPQRTTLALKVLHQHQVQTSEHPRGHLLPSQWILSHDDDIWISHFWIFFYFSQKSFFWF